VALIGAGVIDFSFLEHQTFPLAEVNEALSAADDRSGGFSNVVVWLDEHQKAVSLFHLDMLSFEERLRLAKTPESKDLLWEEQPKVDQDEERQRDLVELVTLTP
jgi:hypothetical protein